jgi:hypothetical protein
MVHVKKGVGPPQNGGLDSRIRGFKWLLFDDSTCALSNFSIALSLSFLHTKMGFQIEPLSPLGIDSIRFRNYLSPLT